jgi:ubiquinol-cytochrome c reductase iron-sulfur subunit
MSDDKPERPRRDFIVTAAMATTGIGATLAMWPFVAALGPAEDVRAQRIVLNLSRLNNHTPTLVAVGHRPVLVFRRTPDELSRLRSPQEPLRGRALTGSKEPEGSKNWHRSLRPEIAVLNGLCTHGDCVINRRPSAGDVLLCPCCGSKFDLAGRVLSGPAPRNLDVPPHTYIDDTTIEFPGYATG